MKQMDALQKLEQYVNMPSGSADLEGLAAFVSVVEKDMQALGFTVTRHPMAGRGDALECVYGDGEDTLLLIGHMDTVFAREENQPFAVDGDRLTGSGVMDMKGGVLIMQAALAEVLPAMPKRMRVGCDSQRGRGNRLRGLQRGHHEMGQTGLCLPEL